MDFQSKENHPSYGCVTINRMESSYGKSLFGSSIKHTKFIRINICEATHARRHSEDVHYPEKTIVQIYLSPVQFSELIMSAGVGNGVPCTIAKLNNKTIPEPILESKREKFVEEFKNHTDRISSKFNDLINEMTEMTKKNSISKKDRQEIIKKLVLLKQNIEADTPFIASQFNEQMDKTVVEAKGEVEAYISDIIQKTGLTCLQNNTLSLE